MEKDAQPNFFLATLMRVIALRNRNLVWNVGKFNLRVL
jgi:hypothetical protein